MRIFESISRNREIITAHDRHIAAQSVIGLHIDDVGWLFSGSQLRLGSKDGSEYSISLDSVVSAETNQDGNMAVLENFEQKTQRRTIVEVRDPPAR